MEHCYQYGRTPDQHPSYIHLTCKDKSYLQEFKAYLHSQGIATSEFHEPYSNWGLTAIACAIPEDKRHLFAHLKLWRPK